MESHPVEVPSSECPLVVMANANLIRFSDLNHFHFELVHLARLEVVSLVVQFYLVRLEVFAVLVAAVGHQVNVGVGAGTTQVTGVDAHEPCDHCRPIREEDHLSGSH